MQKLIDFNNTIIERKTSSTPGDLILEMVKKPKLSQALANYSKKQAEKAKEKKRQEAFDQMSKNKAQKTSGQQTVSDAQAQTKSKAVANDHVPCHIWTDADKMQQRTKLPFHPSNNSIVLLIGEGDFSYCRALVSAFLAAEKNQIDSEGEDYKRKWRVIATALDNRETVMRKYRKSTNNFAFLEETENVEILFGIDGTKLHENRELKRVFSTFAPTRIIFNFPHTGAGIKDRERNIVAQQKMLQGFFESVIKFMEARGLPENGCTYTTTMMKKDYFIREEVSSQKRKFPKTATKKSHNSDDDESDNEEEFIIDNAELLANNAKILKEDDNFNQFDEKNLGETFEIHCTFKTGDPYDAWKPKALAARTGKLACLQTFKFSPELYPGYQHCRTIGDGTRADEVVEVESWKEFLAGKPAKTFVFSFIKKK